MRRRFSGMRMIFVIWVLMVLFAATLVIVSAFYLLNKLNILPMSRWSIWLTVYITLGCGVGLGTLIAAMFAKRVAQPFSDLSAATERISRGDFDVHVRPVGIMGREVRSFIENFNKMARELRGMEQLRSEFIANVSHEFKTPLSSIQGYATLLQDEELPTHEREEYAQIIIDSTRRLSALANNILRLSKLENQQIVSDMSAFSLDEQLRLAILTVEPQWSAKNISMDVDLQPCTIRGSEELLWQVWSNLLDNAIKFTPEDGEISVQLSRGSDYTLVCVKDTGVGMDEETQKHIFDKFYQADPARSGGGNGLGLALAKRIIDMCGGNVVVKSAPGEGSEFTVAFPSDSMKL